MRNIPAFSRFISSLGIAAALTAGTALAAGSTMMMSSTHDRYGGPAYTGAPNLAAAGAFVQAGGGAAHFNIQTALTSMAGSKLVSQEVSKLETQYGKSAVTQWVKTWNFAVPDALHTASSAGVKLPPPANLHGTALATALVKAGLTPDGVFWTGEMLDHTISHKIHDRTMDDIDSKYGAQADAMYHRITNQAMYDLAHALGATSVKLAAFH